VQLFLVRHPRPEFSEGVCYGRTDLGLTEDVAAVVQRVQPQLPIDAPIYSSPLQRCRLLAEALTPTPRIDARLQEMDFGTWEMQPWSAIDRTALDAWAADPGGFAPPEGESPAQLLARVSEFYVDLHATGVKEAVLITHAGVIKALQGLLRRLPANEWMQLTFAFSSVTVMVARESS
jgi:alpha-ribazole phosphatase